MMATRTNADATKALTKAMLHSGAVIPDDRLYKAVRDNARVCEKADRQRDQAYADRINLWRRCVEAGWTQARIAQAARVTEGAVTQALRRARLSDR
jgi:hypothetical protein